MRTLLTTVLLCCAPLLAAQPPNSKPAMKIFVEKMPNDLDQYLRTEFSKQMGASVLIVVAEKGADATISSLRVVNQNSKVLLWTSDTGDKAFLYRDKPGAEAKVAAHLVSKLKKEIERETTLPH
jgi:hypothetical protein